MRTKLINIEREFISDNKTIECNLISHLYIVNLLDGFNTDLPEILNCDSRWQKFLEKEIPENCLNIDNNYFVIETRGKAICHDDDGFDEKYGQHLAEDRALQKALYIENRIIGKILNIFGSYYKFLVELEYNNYQLINKLSSKIWDAENDYDKI